MNLLKSIFRHLTRRPFTRLYPFVVRPAIADTRGQIVMDIDVCVFCGRCAKCCPANAIAVTRKPEKSWTLDPYACIVCGYCVEACPVHCIHFKAEHRPPAPVAGTP